MVCMRQPAVRLNNFDFDLGDVRSPVSAAARSDVSLWSVESLECGVYRLCAARPGHASRPTGVLHESHSVIFVTYG